MRVLVTGGAGFIGSHVVDKLLAAGHDPLIFDLCKSPYHSAAEAEQVEGDVTDRESLTLAARGCDAIVHLAALADVADVLASPDRAERANAQGTFGVLEAARANGIRRVLYGSTIWVYGNRGEEEVDEDTPLAAPVHLYTATKLAGELYCRSYGEHFGIEYTILRFGIPYGPRARDATVLAAFAGKAEAGEPLPIAGDGSQSRPFVYVEDLADGVVAALRPEAANRTYNLAGERLVTVLEIADAVRAQVRDTGIIRVPARSADLGTTVVSSERAALELGWSPRTRFEEGLARYLAWRRTRDHPRRALILSADIGEGHDLPARALAAGLRSTSPGIEVEVVDGLRAMGRLLTLVVRDGSWFSFNWLPWLFEAQYFILARFRPTRWLALKLMCMLGGRRLRKAVRARDPDVVVSTYPGTTAVLGELRREGRLDVPVVSAITDLAGLQFWAHPGVDLHTVTHRESLEEVEGIAGAGSARWAQPPTSADFLRPRAKRDARRELGLAADGAIVVVSGGGWGIGDLPGAVAAALAANATAVICLTGHSKRAREHLARRFGTDPRVRLMGFTSRMGDLLAAADALIHSTAGLTVLEAQIRGCPVISYGFAVGHIRANNRAYQRFGLARVATSARELRGALADALGERKAPDLACAALPSPAELVLEAKPRVARAPGLRLRATRAATAGAVVFVAVCALMLTDYAYPVLAELLDLSPMTAVATTHPEVGLLVDSHGKAAGGMARQLSQRGMTASLALDDAPSSSTLAMIRRRGDDVIPRLDSGGLFHSLGTRGRLLRTAASLGVGNRFFYEPDGDFTLGQYVLAHYAGGSPVRGSVRVNPGERLGPLHAGQIVQLEGTSGDSRWTATLDSLRSRLARRGLTGVTIPELVHPGSN